MPYPRRSVKRLLPVIHVADETQALEQVRIARDNGADGVWLIDHSNSAKELTEVYRKVRAEHSDFWIGLNFLDLSTADAAFLVAAQIKGVDGLWSDDAGIEDIGPQGWALRIPALFEKYGWHGEYFGGVAFKHQNHVHSQDVIAGSRMAAEAASDWVPIICTSGSATGVAAEIEKIKAMSSVVGPNRLALASGVTPWNAAQYMPYVDHFLVATGISRNFHELDPEKVRMLAKTLHREMILDGFPSPGTDRPRHRSGPHLGYWANDRHPELPEPADFIDENWDADERRQVADYLKAGETKTMWRGFSYCRLCDKSLLGTTCLTDGTYTWPEGFAHYIEEHAVKPPEEFLAHVRAQGSDGDSASGS